MSDSEVSNEFDPRDEEEAPDFFDFLPLPLMLLNSLIFTLLFNDSSDDESDEEPFDNDQTMFNGRPFACHSWQTEIKAEMLKPVKGGSLFDLTYSPVANKYKVNGEPTEKCFHFLSNNVDRHTDDDGNSFLSRPVHVSFQGNCSIEWIFDFGELQKSIVCAKAVLKSELLRDDSSITWSILVGNHKKWKTIRSENKRSLFDESINLTEYLTHQKKFHLKVEMSGRGKRSLPGYGSTKLFEQHESQGLQADFFHLKIWLASEPVISPVRGNSHDHSRLINQSQGSDFTIISGDRTLHAHRSILSDRSEYFRALLSSGMEEAQRGQISFPDIDSRVLLQVLKFLYSAGNIPDKLLFRFGQKQVNGQKVERVDVTDLLLLAGRLNLVPLIQRCERRLIPYVDLECASDLLALALDTGANQLRDYCEIFIEANEEELQKYLENKGKQEGGEQPEVPPEPWQEESQDGAVVVVELEGAPEPPLAGGEAETMAKGKQRERSGKVTEKGKLREGRKEEELGRKTKRPRKEGGDDGRGGAAKRRIGTKIKMPREEGEEEEEEEEEAGPSKRRRFSEERH